MPSKLNITLTPGSMFGWQIANFDEGSPSRAAIMALFWSGVKRAGEWTCWSFFASDDPAACDSAAAFSWLVSRGPVPDGSVLNRSCDSPNCVNPGHLFLTADPVATS
jgi:hypothetical protein